MDMNYKLQKQGSFQPWQRGCECIRGESLDLGA